MSANHLDPRLANQPVANLESLITPSMIKALRQCNAKTIGDAHSALVSGRFRKKPGMGAVRETTLARAIAFAQERQRNADRRTPRITDPIDFEREFGGLDVDSLVSEVSDAVKRAEASRQPLDKSKMSETEIKAQKFIRAAKWLPVVIARDPDYAEVEDVFDIGYALASFMVLANDNVLATLFDRVVEQANKED